MTIIFYKIIENIETIENLLVLNNEYVDVEDNDDDDELNENENNDDKIDDDKLRLWLKRLSMIQFFWEFLNIYWNFLFILLIEEIELLFELFFNRFYIKLKFNLI